MYQKGKQDKDWDSFQFTTLEGGRVTKHEIEQAKQDLDIRTFRQEFEASFETYAGAVYYNFHAVDSVVEREIDWKKPLHIGMDFNVDPMSACVAQIDKDIIYVVDEIVIYGSNTDEMCQEIKDRYGTKVPIIIYPDPACRQRKTSAGSRTDLSILQNAGFTVKAKFKHTAIRDRVNVVNACLKDSKGKRVRVDDERLGPIWEVCGELGIPVLIHSADPFQFWLPKDDQNERWFELKEKPNRYYGDSDFIPPFEDIIEEQHTVFERHKNTIFINAHLGWMGNDLKRLGDHLDKFPNVVTEFGAVIAELGRQPKTARQFFIDYQDRIMFGKDSYNKEEFYTYFRVLESDDEYFDYFRKRHAFWKMYGLNLPDEVLKKIYYENALRLFPSIPKDLFR